MSEKASRPHAEQATNRPLEQLRKLADWILHLF